MTVYSLSGVSVLVVDDNQFMRKLLIEALQAMGVGDVAVATNGVTALEKLRAQQVDLVVTDLEMENGGGLELMRAVRKGRSVPDPLVPILVLSANTLAKTIHALATFVECSGHSPGTAALAEDLLVLAWPMKNSVFPELRRAVLLSVACAMSYLNLEAFLARGGAAGLSALQTMTAWTGTMGELDPDGECRKLAKILLGEQQQQQQHLARWIEEK